MAIQRLGIGEFLGYLIEFIEEKTGLPCYDDPNNKESPFFSVQLSELKPANTKTMFMDEITVWIHCISEPVRPYSSAPVLRLVKRLEEAMYEGFSLPEPFNLFRQELNGLQTIKQDESDEGHAILAFSFYVVYGFRTKDD